MQQRNHLAYHQKEKGEITKALLTQCKMLSRAVACYDRGEDFSVLWMANSLNVICADRGKSHVSILKALGIKEKFWVESTVRNQIDPNNLAPVCLLTQIRLHNDTISYVPRDSKRTYPNSDYKKLPVDEWLDERVLRNSTREYFSRRNIVNWIRNTVGGAHFDATPKAKNAYLHLGSTHAFTFVDSQGQKRAPLAIAEIAAMRQIANELMISVAAQSELHGISYGRR